MFAGIYYQTKSCDGWYLYLEGIGTLSLRTLLQPPPLGRIKGKPDGILRGLVTWFQWNDKKGKKIGKK